MNLEERREFTETIIEEYLQRYVWELLYDGECPKFITGEIDTILFTLRQRIQDYINDGL